MAAKQLKVVHISTAKSWRGGEQQIAYLADELSRRQISQVVVCLKNAPLHRWCKERKIRAVGLSKWFSIDPFFAYRLSRVARRQNSSLLHAHDSHAHTAAVLAHDIFGAKLPIVVSRRVDFKVGENSSSRYKYNHPAVKKIACVSEAIAAVLKPVIEDEERLAVVHSGVDPQKFAAAQVGKLRREYNLPPEVKLIGNVAALVGHKDYFTFLRTARVMKQRGAAAHFFIIGSGELREELESYSEAQGIADIVHFTGFRRDVVDLLPELDALLFCSEMEGLGTTILDAFAAGVPVVATRAGGISELIDHEECGLLAEVKDYSALANLLTRLLEDTELRQALVAGGKEKLKNFSPAAVSLKMLELYRGIKRD